jgi:hypothetical protein
MLVYPTVCIGLAQTARASDPAATFDRNDADASVRTSPVALSLPAARSTRASRSRSTAEPPAQWSLSPLCHARHSTSSLNSTHARTRTHTRSPRAHHAHEVAPQRSGALQAGRAFQAHVEARGHVEDSASTVVAATAAERAVAARAVNPDRVPAGPILCVDPKLGSEATCLG